MWSCVGRGGSGTTHPKNHRDSHSLYIYGQCSPGLMGFVVYFFLQAQGLWSGWAAPTSLGKKRLLPLSRFQRLSVLFFPVFDPISKCLHFS